MFIERLITWAEVIRKSFADGAVDEVISIISQSMALRPGDLIYTGTPAGVGPMQVGDVVQISIDGLGAIEHTIVAPDARFQSTNEGSGTISIS